MVQHITETHGWQNIGKFGYSHWASKYLDEKAHTIKLVPQSIADGWEAYCSCGDWKGFGSFYYICGRDELIAALKTAHAEHAVNRSPTPPKML